MKLLSHFLVLFFLSLTTAVLLLSRLSTPVYAGAFCLWSSICADNEWCINANCTPHTCPDQPQSYTTQAGSCGGPAPQCCRTDYSTIIYDNYGYTTSHEVCNYNNCIADPNAAGCVYKATEFTSSPIDAQCDAGTCGTCSGAAYNTCSSGNGTKSCNYTYLSECSSYGCIQNTQNVACNQFNCDANQGYTYCSGGTCQRDCNAGTVNCNACTGGSLPTNTCGTATNGSQTCQHNTWNGQASCNITNFAHTCSLFIDNCSNTFTCTGGNSCETSMTIHVYNDFNHNATEDAEDTAYSNATVTIGSQTKTTDASGNVTFSNLTQGTYTVRITGLPADQTTSTASSFSVTLDSTHPGNRTVGKFGVTQLFNISGIIYNDLDAGNCYNPAAHGCTDMTTNPDTVHGAGIDTPYTSGSTSVTVTGNGVNQTLTQANGVYDSGTVLKSGTYTVTFTTLPTNYHMTYPIGSIPPSFSVTVGTPGKSVACSANSYNDASCDATGDITNLNFGMNNEIIFSQYPCTDVRDEVTTQNFLPNNATCGGVSNSNAILGNNFCSTGPGIYAAGNVTPDFGLGQVSANNWLVGGATSENYTPVNPGVIRTSSSYLHTTITNNGLPTTDITDVCTNTSCYLPDNLSSGIYVWPYDTTFMGTHNTGTGTDTAGTYTFPSGKNYVFVIGDSTNQSDITFKTKILVPNTSTVTFVASKDIVVDPSIGESNITSTNPDLEGYYSADESFIIESSYVNSSRCTDSGGTRDLRFNLIGSLVVNATGNGGSLVNQRDLCLGDLSCPAFTVGNGTPSGSDANLGFTYLLNAPQAIRHKNTFWQELAP